MSKGWWAQGLKLYKRKIYDEAAKCFKYAGNEKYEKLAIASSAYAKGNELLSLSKGKGPDSIEYKCKAKDLFEKAAILFWELEQWKIAGELFYSIGHYQKASECYKNERIKMQDATNKFEGVKKIEYQNEAKEMANLEGKCYWKTKNFECAEKLFLEMNNMIMYIKTLFKAGKYEECKIF